MALQDINVVCAESLQATLDSVKDVLAAETAAVQEAVFRWVRAHRHVFHPLADGEEDFGENDNFISVHANLLQSFAKDPLALATGVGSISTM